MPDHHPDLLTRAVYTCRECGSGEVLKLRKAEWMHGSLGDMKIRKEPRHSGQRFLLIRNPCFSTANWIPGW